MTITSVSDREGVNQEWFYSELTNQLGVTVSECDGPAELSEIGWDSLTLMEFVSWADGHGVELDLDLVSSIRTVDDLWAWVGSKLADRTVRVGSSWSGLRGPTVQLQPIGPRYEDLVASWLIDPDNLIGYQLRGGSLSPERSRRILWDSTLTQFVAQTHDGAPVGWVAAIQPDLRNRHVHLTAVADRDHRNTGRIPEAVILLVGHLFSQYDLRKVYAEVLSSNVHQFASGADRYFRVEGRLADHEYINGRYEDMLILATDRPTFAKSFPSLVPAS